MSVELAIFDAINHVNAERDSVVRMENVAVNLFNGIHGLKHIPISVVTVVAGPLRPSRLRSFSPTPVTPRNTTGKEDAKPEEALEEEVPSAARKRSRS